MRIKTILLAIVTVISFGFTSCTEEFGGDNTQGKPGYLTINVKTLKLNQSKVEGDGENDFKFIKNLNIFVFNEAGNILIQKYIAEGFETTNQNSFDIPVTTLPDGAYVVAVANYQADLFNITTLTALQELPITTVKNFAEDGLHMTGKATIYKSTVDGYTAYKSEVRIAPVESKITVQWNLSTFISQHYTVTGIYIVNAINQTKLPIIRTSGHTDGVFANATNMPANDKINLFDDDVNTGSKSRTASTGYEAPSVNTDFNFYHMSTSEFLKNENEPLSGPYHYYMGENYSNNLKPVALDGTTYDNEIANADKNANTIVLLRVSPKFPHDTDPTGKDRYYTFEIDSTSTPGVMNPNNDNLGTNTTEGFSTRRKTNYTLTFNLSTLGSELPFERMRNLNVKVTAEGWDKAGVNAPF